MEPNEVRHRHDLYVCGGAPCYNAIQSLGRTGADKKRLAKEITSSSENITKWIEYVARRETDGRGTRCPFKAASQETHGSASMLEEVNLWAVEPHNYSQETMGPIVMSEYRELPRAGMTKLIIVRCDERVFAKGSAYWRYRSTTETRYTQRAEEQGGPQAEPTVERECTEAPHMQLRKQSSEDMSQRPPSQDWTGKQTVNANQKPTQHITLGEASSMGSFSHQQTNQSTGKPQSTRATILPQAHIFMDVLQMESILSETSILTLKTHASTINAQLTGFKQRHTAKTSNKKEKEAADDDNIGDGSKKNKKNKQAKQQPQPTASEDPAQVELLREVSGMVESMKDVATSFVKANVLPFDKIPALVQRFADFVCRAESHEVIHAVHQITESYGKKLAAPWLSECATMWMKQMSSDSVLRKQYDAALKLAIDGKCGEDMENVMRAIPNAQMKTLKASVFSMIANDFFVGASEWRQTFESEAKKHDARAAVEPPESIFLLRNSIARVVVSTDDCLAEWEDEKSSPGDTLVLAALSQLVTDLEDVSITDEHNDITRAHKQWQVCSSMCESMLLWAPILNTIPVDGVQRRSSAFYQKARQDKENEQFESGLIAQCKEVTKSADVETIISLLVSEAYSDETAATAERRRACSAAVACLDLSRISNGKKIHSPLFLISIRNNGE